MKAHSLAARAASTLTLVALAACSGGSGVPSSPIGTTGGSGGTSTQGAGTAPVTFTFKIPRAASSTSSAKRSPDYLSYAVGSIVISYTNNGGAAQQIVLPNTNPTSTGCSGVADSVVCTTTDYAPVGTDVFTVTAYDAQQTPAATSNFQGNIVGQITNDAVTVTAGTNTPVGIVLGGPVQTGKIVVVKPSPSGASTSVVQFFGYDADGYLIAGPYTSAVTLTSSDVSTTLLVNGAPTAGAASVTTTSSNDAITLVYSGAPVLTGNGVVTISGSTPTTTQQTAPTITSGSFEPTTASNTPSDLVYVGGEYGTTSNPNSSALLYDVGKATRTSSTVLASPSYLLSTGTTVTGTTLGSQNQLLVRNANFSAGYNGLSAFAMPPLPPNNPEMVTPAYPNATTTVQSSVFSSDPSNATTLQDGEIVQGSPNVAELAVFSAGANGNVNPERVYPIPAGLSNLTVDRAGNVWGIGGSVSLPSAYTASAQVYEIDGNQLTNSPSGTTLVPDTVLNPGTNAGQIVDPGLLAFDASGNVYVARNLGANEVWAFSSSVRGTSANSAAPVANEYFTAAAAQNVNGYGGFDVDPKNGYIVMADGAQLDYFVGLGQNGAPTGGTTSPFQTITLTGDIYTQSGDVHFLH